MVRPTALDTQVSLRNQIANLSCLSSNMAVCDLDIQVSLCNQM